MPKPVDPTEDFPERLTLRVRFLADPSPTVRSRAIRMRHALKHLGRALGIRVEILAGEPDETPPQGGRTDLN